MRAPNALDYQTARGKHRINPHVREWLGDSGIGTIRDYLGRLEKVFGNISIGSTISNADDDQNTDMWKATATSGAADAEFAVPHKLGRVPIGFMVLSQDKVGSVYKGATAWTSSNIYLKVSTSATVALVLLIV